MSTDLRIGRPPPTALMHVRDPDDRSYPAHLLVGQTSSLVLFCAAWHGRQDAVYHADAGLRASCVDSDGARLKEMQAIYPPDWSFFEEDVFAFAKRALMTDWKWDIVSLDPFTSLFDRCADELETWCVLARRAVVLGSGAFTIVEPPRGWRVSEERRRSDFQGGIFWSVIEREEATCES